MNPFHRRKLNYVIIIFAVVILGVGLYFVLDNSNFGTSVSKTDLKPKVSTEQKAAKQEPDQQDFQDASFEGNGKWYGLCPKNSIHSINDFRKTVENDPVLKAHFAGFKWENAKMGKLEKAMRAYVYYRKNNTIFRKKTPITLPQGDGYITDGATTIRTGCCNNYTAAPPAGSEMDISPSAGPEVIDAGELDPSAGSAGTPPLLNQQSTRNRPSSLVSPLNYDKPRRGTDQLADTTPPSPPGDDTKQEKKQPPVPIGAPILLLGSGLIALLGFRRKGKK